MEENMDSCHFDTTNMTKPILTHQLMIALMKKLTQFERLILVNQFKIMKHLGIGDRNDNDKHYDEMIEIIEQGYTYHYDDILQHSGIYSEVPAENPIKVIEIFQMFRKIGNDLHQFTNEELKEAGKTTSYNSRIFIS